MSIIAQLISRNTISLDNPLDRHYVQQLIANAVSLQAPLAVWRPLYVMSALERDILSGLTSESVLLDVLARLPLRLINPLEQQLLIEDISTFWPNDEPTYLEYMQSLVSASVLKYWWRFNETSGNLVNHGSGGSAHNGTLSAVTQGQTGLLGPNDAYLFDGASSRITVGTPDAETKLLGLWLVNPTTAGEGNKGRLWDGNNRLMFMAYESATQLSGQLYLSGANAPKVVTATAPTNTAWAWQFAYGDLAGVNQIKMWQGKAGVVTEYGYSSQSNPGVGPIDNDYIGNNVSLSRTFNGLIDEGAYCVGISESEALSIMQAVTTKAGV